MTAPGKPRVLGGHTGVITQLAWSAEGQLLSASEDATARVWTLGGKPGAKAKAVVLRGHLRAVTGVAAIAGGARAVTASADKGVRIFDAASGKLVQLCKGHTSAVVSVVAAAKGTGFASTSEDGSVRQWSSDGKPGAVTRVRPAKTKAAKPDARVTEAMRNAHDDRVTAVGVSADGALIAIGAADGAIHVWEIADVGGRSDSDSDSGSGSTATKVKIEKLWTAKGYAFDEDVEAAAPDTVWLAEVGKSHARREHAVATGKLLRTLALPSRLVQWGRTNVVTVTDAQVTILSRKTGKPLQTVKRDGPIPDGNPLGRALLWPTYSNQLGIVEVDANRITMLPLEQPAWPFGWSADGTRALVCSLGERAWLVDVAHRRVIAALDLTGMGPAAGLSFRFTHDDTRAVFGTEAGHVVIIDAHTGALRAKLAPPDRAAAGTDAWICTSPTADRAVAWGDRSTAGRVIDTRTGKLLAPLFTGVKQPAIERNVRFSPDGKVIVAHTQLAKQIGFFDGATGKPIAVIPGHKSSGSQVHFAFYAGGRSVISWALSDDDKNVRAWDVATGKQLWAQLDVPGARVGKVIVSPDSRYAAICAQAVRIIDLTTGTLVGEVGRVEGNIWLQFRADSRTLLVSSNAQLVQCVRITDA